MEVKPGYKQTEVGVIPEEWEVKAVREIGQIKTGPFGTLLKADEYSGTEGVPLISVGEVGAGMFKVTEHTPRVPDKVIQRLPQYVLRCGDIVFGRKGAVERSALVTEKEDGWFLGSDGIGIRPQRFCFPPYLACQFQRHEVQSWLLQNAIGTTMASLNQGILGRVQIPYAPLPEQRAIAAALSDVDGLLGGLDRLLAKKRDLKQAAMQQLLTGQTRLPGFHGEWDETTLGELATFLSGGTPSRSNDDYWTGDIPWISASSLRCFEIWRSDSNVTKEAVAAGSKMAPVGSSLLLVRGSALHNEILCGLVTKPVCFNQDVKALVPRSQVVPRFLTLFIRGTAEEFLKLVSSAGNTAGVLDTKLLKAFAINLPPLAEQTAIAEVLTEMDAELAVLEQRREKTRALKQAMMQELLTGRTRLL
jgi:type I restriction enzyme S subunit